ncbi:MAG: ACP S-malonyltransferase [Micrococcales bacterium 73-13]|nr:MAG: ACP S-malonyltransferase [Micrococcales bacterium 73-13]
MIVVVAPGQGSQTPGFLAPWLELPGARARLEALGAEAGVDLVAAGTQWDADAIRDTAVAQPLIVAAGLLTLTALGTSGVGGIAGHSVGELTAAAGAGILTDDEAIRLVAERGRAMAEAAALEPTGMAAVLGGDPEDVLAALEARGLVAANMNGGGQTVAAGPRDAIGLLAAEPPTGARVIPLQVAGAFHTRYMAPAVERLRAAADRLSPADPALPIWTNRDGSRIESGRTFLDLIVGQVANPVRWDLVMDSLAAAGVTGVIELAPAGALVGLVKRGLKGVPTVAVKTPDDLAAARGMIEAQGDGEGR